MNGSKSPDPAKQLVDSGDDNGDAPATTNGHRSPVAEKQQASLVPSIEGGDTELPHAPVQERREERATGNGGDDDAASEAETLIDSPVKKKRGEKQNLAVQIVKQQKSRIGGLPVPGDDDEDDSTMASPIESTEATSIGKGSPIGDVKEDVEMLDEGSDKENGSESLSSVRSSTSKSSSRASSRSRALSERPEAMRHGISGSPNPRKRKHRASSVSLPNSKRRSMDPPKHTRLRGLHSEDSGAKMGRPPSPKAPSHRRAVSTQSALDGTVEGSSGKRSTYPGRGLKSAKSTGTTGWEESDASSETTSRGIQDESKRPQRGIGRSTSTPGRHIARELKRHVNKYGFTRLAEACEEGDVELVKEWRKKDPDQLELAEFAGNKPLQIAALNGNAEVVRYLIDQGCQIDVANVDKDTPLIDAAENGHLEVVKLLLEAGVDPMRQNLKGQQALDAVTDETDEAKDIRQVLHTAIDHWNSSEAKQRREEEEEQRHRAGPSKELHFMARTYENLLKLVQNNDRNGVREFLAARVPVDNAIIAAAARTGDLYLVNMLLAEMTDKKAGQKPEKPMLAVLGTSHFEMVKALTELDNFNPLWRSRSGKSWPELAAERNGPMLRQERELLQRLYDAHAAAKARRSSSPVTKRDSGKRRLHPSAEDDSDEDGERAPKRKNGRRLMSRKDMRAASGKGALSDSSDDEEQEESTPEAALSTEPEEATSGLMKPPGSPSTRRRLRSKSISSQPSDLSPKSLRRRSSSLRGAADRALPTLDEKVEDKDSGFDGIVVAEQEKIKKEREEEAMLALHEARRLEDMRKEEEEAEAEARRAEEMARRVEEDRKAEERRKAEEEAKAAAEARKKEEEVRMFEQAKKAEEERLQREREHEEAKAQYRAELLESLPPALKSVLDLDSASTSDPEAHKSYLLRHFVPLRVLQSRHGGWSASEGLSLLNIQAAPLIKSDGLELLLKPGSPGFEGSIAQLSTQDLEDGDLKIADQILAHLPTSIPGNEDEEMQDVETSFEAELTKTAERYNAFVAAKKKLRDPERKGSLRRVKLEDVLGNLHPLLEDSKIEIEFAMAASDGRREEVAKQLEVQGTRDFVRRIQMFWARGDCQPTAVVQGQLKVMDEVKCASFTDVVVVHEK